jgi:hypothetical protein
MIPLYAFFNDVLLLCMIMAVNALLVGRSLSFASPHFVLSMSSTHASNSQKPSYANVSTINSYAWYLQAIPSKFSCATFKKNLWNTSRFVTLFLAHGDVVVRFAIFHIVLFQKKVTPPWYVNVGGHPMESVSHGLWKEKGGEECQAL